MGKLGVIKKSQKWKSMVYIHNFDRELIILKKSLMSAEYEVEEMSNSSDIGSPVCPHAPVCRPLSVSELEEDLLIF